MAVGSGANVRRTGIDATEVAPLTANDIAEYIAAYHSFHPHRAIWDGRHEHDGQVPDFSRAAIQRRISALERWSAYFAMSGAPHAGRSTENFAARNGLPPGNEPEQSAPLVDPLERDRALAQYACNDELFRWRDWRPHEHNPGFYHGALDVTIYLKRPYAPADERLEALTRHLRGVPEVLAAARENVSPPLSGPAVEQAIHAYKALCQYYEQPLRFAGLALARNGAVAAAFDGALAAATHAVADFVSYLREQTGHPGGHFRLGSGALAAMIYWGEQVDTPLDRLRAVGLAELERHRARAEELAGSLGMSVREAFDALGQTHSAEHEVLAQTAVAVEDVRAFLASSGVVDVLDEATYHVTATPSFMRAGSAFMDAPGPFERPGQPAYLYVTLPDPDWPAPLRKDWLAKLNPWGLRNTAMHEAYPGHLLHFLRLAQAQSTAARSFTSYACIEGWAHYAEKLMIELGYGAGSPYTELAHLSMALLRDCRFLVALDLHMGCTTIPEAAHFVAGQTHLAPIRCRQEALRGAQDPGYLYYALGKLILLQLRADYARQEGARYSLRRFHDAFLACGAPPLPLVRRMLLAAPGGELL
jgi:hypothetical protein